MAKKTLFVTSHFCSTKAILLTIDLWFIRFVLSFCIFNPSTFEKGTPDLSKKMITIYKQVDTLNKVLAEITTFF